MKQRTEMRRNRLDKTDHGMKCMEPAEAREGLANGIETRSWDMTKHITEIMQEVSSSTEACSKNYSKREDAWMLAS